MNTYSKRIRKYFAATLWLGASFTPTAFSQSLFTIDSTTATFTGEGAALSPSGNNSGPNKSRTVQVLAPFFANNEYYETELIAMASISVSPNSITLRTRSEADTYIYSSEVGGRSSTIGSEAQASYTVNTPVRVKYIIRMTGCHGDYFLGDEGATGHIAGDSLGEVHVSGPSTASGVYGGNITTGYDILQNSPPVALAYIDGDGGYSRNFSAIESPGQHNFLSLGSSSASFSYNKLGSDWFGDGHVQACYNATCTKVFFELYDIDQDGDVDGDDFLELTANIGGDPDEYDINLDGIVDQLDIAALSQHLSSQ